MLNLAVFGAGALPSEAGELRTWQEYGAAREGGPFQGPDEAGHLSEMRIGQKDLEGVVSPEAEDGDQSICL